MQLARSKGSLTPAQVLLAVPIMAADVKGTCLCSVCLNWLSCFFIFLQCRAVLWPSLVLCLRWQAGYLVDCPSIRVYRLCSGSYSGCIGHLDCGLFSPVSHLGHVTEVLSVRLLSCEIIPHPLQSVAVQGGLWVHVNIPFLVKLSTHSFVSAQNQFLIFMRGSKPLPGSWVLLTVVILCVYICFQGSTSPPQL